MRYAPSETQLAWLARLTPRRSLDYTPELPDDVELSLARFDIGQLSISRRRHVLPAITEAAPDCMLGEGDLSTLGSSGIPQSGSQRLLIVL